jgi:hypothetical protein
MFTAEQLSAMPEEVVSFIKNQPEKFAMAEAREITRGSLGEKVLGAFKSRKADLSSLGKGYEGIRLNKTDLIDLPQAEITESLARSGLKLANDGSIIESGKLSSRLSEVDLAQVNKAAKLIEGIDKMDAEQVLNLREKLDDLVSFDKGLTNNGEKIIYNMRTIIDEKAGSKIKGLKDLDAQYAPEIREIKRLEKDFIDPATGQLKDEAINKIANILGKGKDEQLGRLESLIPGISDDIAAVKAFETVESAGLKPGAYRATAASVGIPVVAGTMGNIPLAVLSAILLQPKLITKAIVQYGKAERWSAGKIKYASKALEDFSKKLTPEQKSSLEQFFNSETFGDVANALRIEEDSSEDASI